MMSDGSSSGWIYYLDESYDSSFFCLSALGLKLATWRRAFEAVKAYRQQLKQSDGVLLRTEIHARDLTRGRGRLGPKVVGKWRRSMIFSELLEVTASLPDVHLFNACLDVTQHRDPQLTAWDRILNRLNRTCEERNRQENAFRRNWLSEIHGSAPASSYAEIERRLIPYSAHAIIIADKGREMEIIRLKRKLTVANFVPSRLGSWGTSSSKNLPLTHFVEDALFVDSAHSYFIQLADCVAFALLKRETAPTPQVRKYGLDKAFNSKLRGICLRQASPKDPDGVVRK